MPSSSALSHVADFTPPAQDRTWLTCPHPRLPIAATCGTDKSVRIYSLVNFRLLSTISGGHKRSVRSCAWKPNLKGESVLATASFDATVGVWRRWDSFGQDDGMFNSDKDNDYQNGDIADVDAGDREEQADEEEEWAFDVLLDGHDSEVKSVSWSPSGSLLATCSRDKSIWIWEDLEDGDNNFETVAVLQEHSADVKCVAWHPNEDCLASGSYDNTIRLWREDVDDWGQIACLRGHDGTVWTVDWEAGDEGRATTIPRSYDGSNEDKSSTRRQTWLDERPLRGPRIVSCSDDRTVRIWRKRPRERNATAASSTGIPSIIRPEGTDETWFEETKLPHAHDLSVYSVAWSKWTGLLASTGADGRIVIYQERFTQRGPEAAEPADTEMTANAEAVPVESSNPENRPGTEWHIIAKVEAAHGIYEVNHVAWAVRGDRGVKKSQYSTQSQDAEEILLSTGDDGVVKAWKIEL